MKNKIFERLQDSLHLWVGPELRRKRMFSLFRTLTVGNREKTFISLKWSMDKAWHVFSSDKIRDVTLNILFFIFKVCANYFSDRTNFIIACKFKHMKTSGEVPHHSANSLPPIVVQCWILIVHITVS